MVDVSHQLLNDLVLHQEVTVRHTPFEKRRGSSLPSRRCRASRGGAPADLREALVGPLERVQVGGVVQVERRIGEPDDPPARRGAPRAREQLRVAGRVREPDGLVRQRQTSSSATRGDAESQASGCSLGA